MRSDNCTKTMLTIIAACLVYLYLGRPAAFTTAHAAPDGMRVLVASWVDSGGHIKNMNDSPLPVRSR